MSHSEALSALVRQLGGLSQLLGSTEEPIPAEAAHGLALTIDAITAPARKALQDA